MLNTTRAFSLRFLAGAQALRTNPVESTFADFTSNEVTEYGRRLSPDEREALNLANKFDPTTRIGGARIIAETQQNFYRPVENSDSPFHFVRRSPREAGLCPSLCRELRRLKIERLTELQAALIPYVMRGKHMIAHAETGSGKSFGVMLAVANKIERDAVAHRMHTVILVPTNELAVQYDRWFKHFVSTARHVVFAASESIPIEEQLARLHNFQPHVLVGTPQAIGAIQRHSKALFGAKLRRHVDTIILDEADVVLGAPVTLKRRARDEDGDHDEDADGDDDEYPSSLDHRGGQPSDSSARRPMTAEDRRLASVRSGADVVDRLYRCESEEVPAHIVALSATIDGSTARMLNAWMLNDETHRLTTSIVEHNVPDTLTFYFWPATPSRGQFPMPKCLALALRLIHAQHGAGKYRVLVLTSESLRDVASIVDEASSAIVGREDGKTFTTGLLHDVGGDRHSTSAAVGRSLRRGHQSIFAVDESVVSKLSRGVINVGIGRFETARGLNITGVTHVIAYGAVPSINDFVHGAGRTGRNGADGEVITIFPPEAARATQQIANVIGIPWRSNRASDVGRLTVASESQAADAPAAELAVGEELRRRAAEALDGDGSRSFVSPSRLIELRSGRGNATAAAAVAFEGHRKEHEEARQRAAVDLLAEDLTAVDSFTSDKHSRFAAAVQRARGETSDASDHHHHEHGDPSAAPVGVGSLPRGPLPPAPQDAEQQDGIDPAALFAEMDL